MNKQFGLLYNQQQGNPSIFVTPDRNPTTTTITPISRKTRPGHFHPFMAQRIVALDCEMVGTGPGGYQSTLARVSLVDYYGRCLFDTFVRVNEEVTDYRTNISGIRDIDLKSSQAITFDQCRSHVQTLIMNKVLVGHGLVNDLNVLKIEHPWYNIRDTTMYEPYMKMDHHFGLRPMRLKDLAFHHLGIVIQQEGKAHDSKEDAAAAMALYRKAQTEWDFAMDCKRRSVL